MSRSRSWLSSVCVSDPDVLAAVESGAKRVGIWGPLPRERQLEDMPTVADLVSLDFDELIALMREGGSGVRPAGFFVAALMDRDPALSSDGESRRKAVDALMWAGWEERSEDYWDMLLGEELRQRGYGTLSPWDMVLATNLGMLDYELPPPYLWSVKDPRFCVEMLLPFQSAVLQTDHATPAWYWLLWRTVADRLGEKADATLLHYWQNVQNFRASALETSEPLADDALTWWSTSDYVPLIEAARAWPRVDRESDQLGGSLWIAAAAVSDNLEDRIRSVMIDDWSADQLFEVASWLEPGSDAWERVARACVAITDEPVHILRLLGSRETTWSVVSEVSLDLLRTMQDEFPLDRMAGLQRVFDRLLRVCGDDSVAWGQALKVIESSHQTMGEAVDTAIRIAS